MTTDERRAVRLALLDLGYTRNALTTRDDGYGRYSEQFERRDLSGEVNTVTIEWGAKTK